MRPVSSAGSESSHSSGPPGSGSARSPAASYVTIVGEAESASPAWYQRRSRRLPRRRRPLPALDGEGIAYWPLVEVLKQLQAYPSDPVAAAAIRLPLGESEQATSAEEIAWAFRKLLEEQAPLVVLFDDLQWADEAFLDLVEAAALLTRDAPLFLVCMARPELMERRASWPAPLRLSSRSRG